MSLRSKTLTGAERVLAYPPDLAVVTLAAVVGYVALVGIQVGGRLQLLVALPLVLFLPGYALVSVLFPAAARRASTMTVDRPRGIDTVERLGLSFVLSILCTIAVVLVLPVTTAGLDATSTTLALVLVTVALAQIGAVRRIRTPPVERYTVSLRARIDAAMATREGPLETASAVVMSGAVLLAVGALIVALVAPVPGAAFTQLGLFTEDDDGDLLAGGVPDEVVEGDAVSLTATVENHHPESMTYTLVVQQQYYDDGVISERTTLETVETTVDADESQPISLDVTPTADANETVRVSVLLFEDDPPTQPTNENALEDTYVWLSVVADDGGE